MRDADDVDGVAVLLALARPLAGHHHVDAVVGQDALQQADVGEPRHVVEDQRLIGQQARDHQRQRGVLRARDRDRAVQAAVRRRCVCDPCPRCPPGNALTLDLRLVRGKSGGIRGPVSPLASGPWPAARPLLRLAALEVFPERRGGPAGPPLRFPFPVRFAVSHREAIAGPAAIRQPSTSAG